MQVSVLASGSKGNSIFVEAGGTKLLVDAGISARRIRQSLAEIDVHVGDLDGILITHEHRDHIRAHDAFQAISCADFYQTADIFVNVLCGYDSTGVFSGNKGYGAAGQTFCGGIQYPA